MKMRKMKTGTALLLSAALLSASATGAFAETQTEPETVSDTVLADSEKDTEDSNDRIVASVAETEGMLSEEETENPADSETEAETEGLSGEESLTEAESEAGEESASSKAAPETRPEYDALDYVKVGEYKGLQVVLEPIEIAADDIETAVNGEIVARELYDTEGTVEDGDVVNIDYEGKKDGVAFDGGTAAGYDLEIGSGTFIDGFEEGLIGVSAGEETTLALTFPEDYQSEELAGQDVEFTVKVNFIMPELTDDLASSLSDGAYSTAEDYRGSIREKLEEEERDNQVNVELMTQLYNTCEITGFPEDVVDYSVSSMENVYRELADLNGMEYGELIEAYGMTEETFHDAVVENVQQSLQQEMILSAVAETEGIEITPEEYQQGCEQYTETYGYDSVEEFQSEFDEETVMASLLMDKTLKFVYDNAVIEELEETETETEIEVE